MTSFVAEDAAGNRCLVVGFVWGKDDLIAAVLRPDRSMDYEPVFGLKLHKMNMEMPIGFFEWPEDDTSEGP